MTSLQQNLIPNEPELKDLLNLFKKELLLGLNCHHLGTVASFNPLTQTATATINYKKTFFSPNPVTGAYDPVLLDYPVLLDCPVICLGGGNGALTFPIENGDECLIVFNDRDLDNWFSGSNNSAVATSRLHSFSDGLIIVGVRSRANVIPDYNTGALELRTKDGLNKVTIGDDSVTITKADTVVTVNDEKFSAALPSGVTLEIDTTGKLKITNAGGEFVAMLLQLFTDIQTGLVTTMLGPQPLVMPTFTADLTLLETFKA